MINNVNHPEFFLLAMAVILLTGLLASKVTKALHVPNVTGYLIGGILLGPGLLGLIPGFDGILGVDMVSRLKVIVKIELAFIAFTIGCEFKKSFIKSVGPKPIAMATGESLFAIVFITGIIMCFSPLLTKSLNKNYQEIFSLALALGAIGAATAPAATMMVIKQYRAKGPVTDTLVATVAIDDATALIFFGLAIAVIEMMSPKTGASSLGLTIGLPFIEIIVSVILGLIFGFILVALTHFFKGKGTRLCAILVAVLGCAGTIAAINVGLTDLLAKNGLPGNVMNISDLFGIMVLGLIYVNFSDSEEETTMNFDRFTPPFVMMFFVLSGADLNFNGVNASTVVVIIVLITCYVLARSIGKYVGVLLTGKLCRLDDRITKLMSFGLMPQGGVAIGLALVASSLPVLQPYASIISTTIITSCIITELFGPLFTKYMLFKAGEADVTLK